MNIIVTKQAEKKFRKYYPLVQKEDLKSIPLSFSTEWVKFVSEKNQFIASGYLGKQNKGIGWLVNWSGPVNKNFFENLFIEAKKIRSAYEQDPLTTAYRFFNGEGDGLGGLTIDLYSNFAVFSWYNETLYQNKDMIINAFRKTMPEIKGAYEKIRFSSQKLPESKKLFGDDAKEPLLILENGITYATYLNEGLMTGIFLDQKEVRGYLSGGFSAGKKVLNMFSYTGAFSIASAMGGAVETTSVDLAKRSLDKTREQFAVNRLDIDSHKIIVMDVFDYFKYADRKHYKYDLIILDPPSFARNKKRVFSVAKNYGELIKDAVSILNDGGTIVASTNAANLSKDKFKKIIQTALAEMNVSYRFNQSYQLPGDFYVNDHFIEGNYLKVFFVKVKK